MDNPGKRWREELPPQQTPIQTKPLIDFHRKMTMLGKARSFTGYPMIGVLTGPSGHGKTIASIAYADQFDPEPDTLLPKCIYFKIPPQPTANRISAILARILGVPVDLSTGEAPVEQIIQVIRDSNIQLIIADEAKWLDDDCFEILRYIHDDARVSLALVGTDEIIDAIRTYPQFMSRVGLRGVLITLEEDDFFKTVLPNLVFPYWHFDPEREEDKELGKHLWENIQGSFVRLRNLLSVSSLVADSLEEPRNIDISIIEEALEMMDIKSEPQENKESPDSNSRQGTLEQESADRNNRRGLKRRRNTRR